MDNNNCMDDSMDNIDAYVSIQLLVASMLQACGMFMVFIHAALGHRHARGPLIRGPNPYLEQIDHINRLVRDSDRECINQLRMDRRMASTGNSKGKTKVGTSKSRRVWLKREEEYLLNLMKDLLTLQWRQENGQFRHGFLGELEKRIVQAFPGTDLRASPHIESKLKLWKKQYNTLVTMLRTSGFGWNDTEKMIEVESDEVWENYVRRDPDAKQMRNKPFPYYEDWCILFGRDRATGDLAEGPADAVAAISLEGYEENNDTEGPPLEGDPSGTPIDASQSATVNSSTAGARSSSGRKRSRNDGISQGLTDMAQTFGKFFTETNATMSNLAQRIGYHQDTREARQRVNGELMNLPLDRTQRLRAASLIVSDAQRLDLFFSLPEDDRIEWLYMLLGGFL